MKLKKFIVLLLAACVAAAFAACTNDDGGGNGPDDGLTEYTVTVTCPDTPVLNALIVVITAEDGSVAGQSKLTDGVAKLRLPEANYTATITEIEAFKGILSGYVYEYARLTAAEHSATIAIALPDDSQTETVSYTITVQMPNGSPVAGISVQLCRDLECRFMITDAEGKVTFELPPDTYEVHIDQNYVPAGHTFDNSEYTMGPEGGELTITFKTA